MANNSEISRIFTCSDLRISTERYHLLFISSNSNFMRRNGDSHEGNRIHANNQFASEVVTDDESTFWKRQGAADIYSTSAPSDMRIHSNTHSIHYPSQCKQSFAIAMKERL